MAGPRGIEISEFRGEKFSELETPKEIENQVQPFLEPLSVQSDSRYLSQTGEAENLGHFLAIGQDGATQSPPLSRLGSLWAPTNPAENPVPLESELIFTELIQNPEDMENRHIYADSLIKEGSTVRGELINLQGIPDLTPQQKIRVLELEAELKNEIFPDLETPSTKITGIEFKGGFFYRVGITNPDMEILSRLSNSLDGPFIRELYLMNIEGPFLPEFLSQIPFQMLKKLILTGRNLRVGENGARDLLENLKLPNLEHLAINSKLIGFPVIRDTGSSYQPNMKRLELTGDLARDDVVRTLAGSPQLSEVRYLDLRGNDLRNSSARALADSPYVSNLEGLDLSSTGIDDVGARALLESPNLKNLKDLRLNLFFLSPAVRDVLEARWSAIDPP